MNEAINEQAKFRFAENPESFIEDAIKTYVRDSNANRLESFGGEPIYEEPLIGFANGDDPLFTEYRKVVSEQHFMPHDLLTRHLKETLNVADPLLEHVSVIAYILPVSRETQRSNAREKEGPSLRWNHSRWIGQDFNNALATHVSDLLAHLGVYALAPELSPFYKIGTSTNPFISNWSQRHVAYAAGLGTFSLNEGFITAKGMAMRCGSIVAGMKLTPSARPYPHYRANCLFYNGGKCGRCIERCPGGAISEQGHDKLKCFDVLYRKHEPWLKGEHGPGYIGKYAGCGLCQTGVPCASRIPQKEIV